MKACKRRWTMPKHKDRCRSISRQGKPSSVRSRSYETPNGAFVWEERRTSAMAKSRFSSTYETARGERSSTSSSVELLCVRACVRACVHACVRARACVCACARVRAHRVASGADDQLVGVEGVLAAREHAQHVRSHRLAAVGRPVRLLVVDHTLGTHAAVHVEASTCGCRRIHVNLGSCLCVDTTEAGLRMKQSMFTQML
eukprot:2614926-Pleurochrysis_carterae.AAC.7